MTRSSASPSYTYERERPLSDALAAFYAPGLAADTLVERTFALTSRVLRFSLNSHGVIDASTGELTAHFDCALPGLAGAFEAFGRHMAKYEPFRFDPKVNDGKPFSARDFYGQRELEDLDIYQEVYRPMRFVDHCFMHVPTGPEEVVFVGFMRDARPFDPEEKARLEAIRPHLVNGRALARSVTYAKALALSPELFGPAGFTPRECDVLFWLCQGESTPDIARLLGLRADSVRRVLHAVYDKLGVEHRGAATVRALEIARRLSGAGTPSGSAVTLRVATRV